MRVQTYPPHNLAFVGTKTHKVDLSALLPSPFAEFDSEETTHQHYRSIAHLIPDPNAEEEAVSASIKTSGRCWAISDIVDGYRVNTFHFDNVGDQLPWHNHDENSVHTSHVFRGAFELQRACGRETISEGSFIDWRPGEGHGFTAIVAGSVLINKVKKKH